jgi:hypothetical protein
LEVRGRSSASPPSLNIFKQTKGMLEIIQVFMCHQPNDIAVDIPSRIAMRKALR